MAIANYARTPLILKNKSNIQLNLPYEGGAFKNVAQS